jgi:hypothetical protein
MRMVKLFVLSCGLAGLLAMLGSMVGDAVDHLDAGGVIGGLAGCAAAAHSASRRGWISHGRSLPTALASAAGFLAAAWIAVHNLHTPVIPVLSTTLVGIGAVAGSRIGRGAPPG